MATVRFEEALNVIKDNLTAETSYKYADISQLLVDNFEDIRKSQVSGLITRFVSQGYFKKQKEPGARYDYIYLGDTPEQLEIKEDDIAKAVDRKVGKLIEELNSLKVQINNAKDFMWIQSIIESLQKLTEKGN